MVLPVFLLLTMGIVDLGRGVASYSLLANAAKEGARAAIFPQTSDAAIVAAVNSQTQFLGTISGGDIAVSPSLQSERVSGSNITVSVTYRYEPMTPLLSNLVGSMLTFHASATMLIE